MVSRDAGWHLPLLVLAGGLLVGGLLIFAGGVSATPDSPPEAIPAMVVGTTPCGPREARDTVQVMVDGRSEQLVLDGCGNPVGTELQVELWHEESMVRIAGTGPPAGSGLADRVSLLLLVLAGLAGALQTVIVPQRRG